MVKVSTGNQYLRACETNFCCINLPQILHASILNFPFHNNQHVMDLLSPDIVFRSMPCLPPLVVASETRALWCHQTFRHQGLLDLKSNEYQFSDEINIKSHHILLQYLFEYYYTVIQYNFKKILLNKQITNKTFLSVPLPSFLIWWALMACTLARKNGLSLDVIDCSK